MQSEVEGKLTSGGGGKLREKVDFQSGEEGVGRGDYPDQDSAESCREAKGNER